MTLIYVAYWTRYHAHTNTRKPAANPVNLRVCVRVRVMVWLIVEMRSATAQPFGDASGTRSFRTTSSIINRLLDLLALASESTGVCVHLPVVI